MCGRGSRLHSMHLLWMAAAASGARAALVSVPFTGFMWLGLKPSLSHRPRRAWLVAYPVQAWEAWWEPVQGGVRPLGSGEGEVGDA